MTKQLKKLVALVLALCLCLSVMSVSVAEETAEVPSYTYHAYDSALGNNWNPHTWDTSADDTIRSYLYSPFVDMSVEDSEEGVYQWVYEAATSVTDVTADHQDDLTKYDVTLPEGQTAEETTEGYVFEIALNPEVRWENGEAINADSYIYSMKALLDPAMKNYRANLYYAGESAVAGGSKYYYSNDTGMYQTVLSQGYATLADAMAAVDVVIDVWNFWGAQGYTDAEGNEVPQYVSLTDEVVYDTTDAWAAGEAVDAFSGADLLAAYGAYLEVGAGYDDYVLSWVDNENMGATFDCVGLYKVDDYTIRYVTQARIDFNYMMTSLVDNWLVYEPYYEAGKDTTGTLVTTNYGTSVDTTMSFGAYKLESLQADKQIVFVQNDQWYGYEKQDDGSLISYTSFEVDGEKVQQYQTTRVVIDVMDDAAAKQAFLKGELSSWTPSADDLLTYSTSDQLYKADETYTESFFFHTNLEDLKAMDASKGNTNSVVLSNINFRKAMSLAMDRNEFVTATPGWKPAVYMMNSLYMYDAYNDPTSSYRNSEPAMQAICNYYGVEYGEGTPYATLKDAYESINGYNLTEAQSLMKTACEELVADGLYTAGDPIYIRIGWKKGSLDSADSQQIELINKYVNAAAEGSGFGTITFEAIGNLTNRYDDVINGEFAIGWGAWGGAAFYPFRNFQVYCDPDQYDVTETGCWDPTTTKLTISVDGVEDTLTWQEWSGAMVGTGKYASLDNETKLKITAVMEEEYLKFVYRIPMANTTSCEMLSYQVNYYTDEYNIMYGFGGLRLITYNYSDAEWAEYVASVGGTVAYE